MPAMSLPFPSEPTQASAYSPADDDVEYHGVERLRDLLCYDAETGVFTWRKAYCKKVVVGRVAGHRNKTTGYVEIRINGVLYGAHRLAWLYVHGKWPECVIDHIDRDRANNRVSNLRQASHSQNHANGPANANNALGVRNVVRVKTGFRVELKKNYQKIYIGIFPSLAAASLAARNARQIHFGEFGEA